MTEKTVISQSLKYKNAKHVSEDSVATHIQTFVIYTKYINRVEINNNIFCNITEISVTLETLDNVKLLHYQIITLNLSRQIKTLRLIYNFT